MDADQFPNDLDLAAFAELFGTDEEAIPEECRRLIAEMNFRYRILEGQERDAVIMQVLKRVDERKVAVAGKHRIEQWEAGWQENLDAFNKSNGDLAALTPKYIRHGLPLRLNKNFIESMDPQFEFNWYTVFRRWLFKTYFSDADAIFEFGCGSGYNVSVLAELFENSQIVGLDWAEPSVEIINRLNASGLSNVKGRRFDFFEPDYDLDVPENSAFLTVGAIEQTGSNYNEFLDFILAKKPSICVHAEPFMELYDSDSIVDYTALKCLQQRQFIKGYIDRLKELESQGRAEVLKVKRSFFGSMMLESYAQVIWRPI